MRQMTLEDVIAAKAAPPARPARKTSKRAPAPAPVETNAAPLTAPVSRAAVVANTTAARSKGLPTFAPVVAPASPMTLDEIAAAEREIARYQAIPLGERSNEDAARLPEQERYRHARNAWRAALLATISGVSIRNGQPPISAGGAR